MLVVGAGGLARGVIDILDEQGRLSSLAFFDDVSPTTARLLYERFPILRCEDEVRTHFLHAGPDFVVAVGDPRSRADLCARFVELGGQLISLVSERAHLGRFDVHMMSGSIIMPGAVVENGVRIGRGTLIDKLCSVGHDTVVADYATLSPGTVVGGHARIGERAFLGSGCVILPSVWVGEGAIVGAGAVVTKSVEPGTTVVGVPARRIH